MEKSKYKAENFYR